MNNEETSVKSSNIEKLEAYNNFWNLVYRTTILTEQERDRLVSIIMEHNPTMSLHTAELYLAKFIVEYPKNGSKQ